MKERGEVNLHLVLTIFLGVGMVLFGALAIIAYNDNQTTQHNVKSIKDKAVGDAVAKQKKDDTDAFNKQSQLPYQTYNASTLDGGFQLQLPKNWSVYAGHSTTSRVQLDLVAEPAVVNLNLDGGAINTHAFHLQLVNQSAPDINRTFNQKLKSKTVTSKPITVSGIQGVLFTGQFDDQRHVGYLIVLPVRDKSLELWTDTQNYTNEFNNIITTAKINP